MNTCTATGRVTLVPIFYFIKNRSPVLLFLLSEKVALRLLITLVNALVTLRIATNFIQVQVYR